jgi:hypothetical protein
MEGFSGMTIFGIQSIGKSWKLISLMVSVLAGPAGLQQAIAHAAPAPASAATATCVSKALGVGRVVTSPSDCRPDEFFVVVYQSGREAQALVRPGIGARAHSEPAGLDLASLAPSLNAYKSVFAQASGKSRKVCQSVLSGIYQGKLQDLGQTWCDAAKRFEANVENCQLGGSSQSPTLTCFETLTVYPKDGDPKAYRSQKIFHLSGEPDGTWQIAGW